LELVKILIIEEWNPNIRGGAWFPLSPTIGKTITAEKYFDGHYRWASNGSDTVVPLSCFVGIKESCLTVWDKKEI